SGRGSISASTSPFFTIWPSMKLNFTTGPLTCGRTVTVASGVTVPSALSVIGIWPWVTLAMPTGWASPRRPRLCVGWLWDRTQMRPTSRSAATTITTNRIGNWRIQSRARVPRLSRRGGARWSAGSVFLSGLITYGLPATQLLKPGTRYKGKLIPEHPPEHLSELSQECVHEGPGSLTWPGLVHPAQFGHIVGREAGAASPEAGGHIVGDGGDFGIGIGRAKGGHEDRALRGLLAGTGNHHLGDVCCPRIVDGAVAGKRGVCRQRSRTVPVVAACAGAFEDVLAHRVHVRDDAFFRRGGRGRGFGCRQARRGLRWNRFEIGDDGLDVAGGEEAETEIDGFAHRPAGDAAAKRMTRREELRDLIVAPCADTRGLVGGDVVGTPAGGYGPGELAPIVGCLQEIARRVAFAAMRETFDQISAAIPLRGLRRVRFETPVGIEHRRPDRHQPALVIRKRQCVCGRLAAH